MRKRVLGSLLTFILALSMVACGSEESSGHDKTVEVTESQDSGAEVKKETKEETLPTEEEKPEAVEFSENDSVMLHLQVTSHALSYNDYSNDYCNSIHVSWDTLALDEEDASRYPALAAALAEQEKSMGDSMQESMENLKDAYKEMQEYQEWELDLSDHVNYTLLRTDNQILSYRLNADNYYGGAHGYYAMYGAAFDVATGKALSLAAVVKDEAAFRLAVADYLEQEYEDIFFQDIHTTMQEYEMNEFSWTLDYQGVTLYFNPYELASYADGMQTVELSFAEYGDLFDEKYMISLDSYVFELAPYEVHTMDVNKDGVEESFSFDFRYDEEFEYYDGRIGTVTVNGTTKDCAMADYGAEVHFVQTKTNGYLYIFHTLENDYSVLEVVDLTTGENVIQKREYGDLYLYGEAAYEDDEESGIEKVDYTYAVFNTPDKVMLGSRLDMLSTYQGVRPYRIEEDGTLQPLEENYQVYCEFLLHSLKDIPCQVAQSVDGSFTEGVLPKDRFFRIVGASANSVYVVCAVEYTPENEEDIWYFITEDEVSFEENKVYQIIMDEESGYSLNGESLDELLGGMIYAG